MKNLVLLLFSLLAIQSQAAVSFGSLSADVVSKDQQSQLIVKNAKGAVLGTFQLERNMIGPEALKLEHFTVNSKNYIFLDFLKGYSGSLAMSACRDAYLFSVSSAGKIQKVNSLTYECSSQDDGKSTGEANFHKAFTLDKSKATLNFSK